MSQLIGGRFRLLSVLGTGGFGQVWRALDEKLGVEVAIKHVHVSASANDAERAEIVAQAQEEARKAAQLRENPNVVTVHDFVTDTAGAPWLIMRLVEGRTVADEIRARGRLPVEQAAAIAAGTLTALAAAHAAGIVHRDVKPANIMIATDGAVLLTDFGIARQYTDTTQPVLLGTLPYMSPERLNGKDAPAGDMFALGATLYEMVEGVSPFARPTPTAIMSAVTLDQPAPPKHAGTLAPLIYALLDKNPAARPDAADALRRLRGGSASPVPGTGGTVAPQAPSLPQSFGNATSTAAAHNQPPGATHGNATTGLLPVLHVSALLAAAALFVVAPHLPLANEYWDNSSTGAQVKEAFSIRWSPPWAASAGTDWDPAGRIVVASFVVGTPIFIIAAALHPLAAWLARRRVSQPLTVLRAVATLWTSLTGITILGEILNVFQRHSNPGPPGYASHVTLLPGAWVLWLSSGFALVTVLMTENYAGTRTKNPAQPGRAARRRRGTAAGPPNSGPPA